MDYYKMPLPDSLMRIRESRYDYSGFAKKITIGSENDYQKIKAIYQWVCANIDYDTTCKIHTADSCMSWKQGVCQAYCELFQQLAKAVDVRVEIVFGHAKGKEGAISSDGHAWLFAYTRENHGILLDPTWGAGTVDNGQFNRSKNCWVWFNVSPEWMILSHYPKDNSYQLVEDSITWEQFESLPVADILWLEYGLDPHEIYVKAKTDSISLPAFYIHGEGEFEVIDFPRTPTLKIGEYYTFRIKMKSDREFGLLNNSIYCQSKKWKSEGNGIYSITYMPRDTGSLSLSLFDKAQNHWDNLVKYKIEPPTEEDWKAVEPHYPLALPEMKAVKNLYADTWKRAGIDGQALLRLVREHHVSELPLFYEDKGQKLTAVAVPMNKKLKAGQNYTFRFYPRSGLRWMIINNREQYSDWKKSEDGMLSMTVEKVSKGSLILCVQLEADKPFWSCLEYEVSN